jgi:hypothetical protein
MTTTLSKPKPKLHIVKSFDELALEAYHKQLRAGRCVISDRPGVELHHCKGASMVDLLGDAGNPGAGKKVSDWLVIPLHWRWHRGDFGIDNGMCLQGKDKRIWEAHWGKQADFLVRLSVQYKINVFARAGFKVNVPELEGLV